MPAAIKAPSSVLIVDDDPLLCVIAEQFFRSRGADEIRTAGDGEEALALLDAAPRRPDLILCDLNMPKIDGMQFLRLLRDRTYRGAIVILSGEHRSVLSLAEDLARTHQLNIVAALGKPLKPKDLDNVLGRIARAPAAEERIRSQPFDIDELRQAIEKGAIRPHYQPKLAAENLRTAGVEALARWHHDERGIVMPGSFIGLAEQADLIRPLTYSVMQQVVADAARLLPRWPSLRFAINLSPDVLGQIDLPERLVHMVSSAALLPSSFILEVTENGMLRDAGTLEVLARLHLRRFRLSIDDFGTANSNLEHLSRFPFSELKIDRLFAGRVVVDETARAGVEAMILLARRLGLRVVAEGVEDADTASFLINAGVNELQGYHFARPMPFEALVSYLNANDADGSLSS